MKILIYDDNEKDIENLIKCLQIFLYSKKIKYAIYTCDNTIQLLKEAETSDLVFLDIEIGNENGIEIGLKLKQLVNMPRIIITSLFSKYLIDGYKIHADRYFIKPIKQEEFNIEMENIIQNYFEQHIGITDLSISKSKIYLKDILYVEFKDRKTVLHFLTGTILSTPYPLKHWIDILCKYSFGQPHKSFIINIKYISVITKQDIILINDELIPLSRHFKHEFNKHYMECLHRFL